jgi:hypothetical protein
MKKPPQSPEADPARAAIVDEFGDLTDVFDRFAPQMQRRNLLEEEIKSWFRDAEPNKSFVVKGHRYEVQVGVREYRRKITHMVKLFTLLGKAQFLALCTFPLKHLEDTVSPRDQAAIVEKERSGPRSIRSLLLKSATSGRSVNLDESPRLAS